MATLPEVQVELYVSGTGPRHSFKEKLQGWEANRLDLETIMNKYSLKALYAYSLSNGRGQRLIQHPRNGLSMVCYSGKPDVVIRLDSDPKTSMMQRAVLMTVIISVIILLILAFSDEADKPLWFKNFQALGGGGIGWLVAFMVIVLSQVTGWPRKQFR
ncbi:hypothetical protein MPTK1_1g04000 [Marchantia polymorpha subsp. ruderalis]|uniref:Uncharacterized protein n=2 Tax=Marchantia polymorpha TaxID=3197 RepID=A0AAF6ALA5_MARPO|nr:hypothetical protein MARPO_0005s0207 [Marchantia polymorpha]BBM97225.1 hypothetical protein Mp_1g04000 [Marchantia polymorpha subsp. ruderalis]|eukprot:PTQ48583.1 hypothetical protein MARPO_0005s0207 [Marchantia polymorpha]